MIIILFLICCVHGMTLDEWDVLGPFPYGYRELGSDPLIPFGGIRNITRKGSMGYPSEIVPFGMAKWSVVRSDSDGRVAVKFPEVNWGYLDMYLGYAGQLWQGWGLSDFTVDVAGVYLMQCVDYDFTQTFTQSAVYVDDVLLNGATVAYEFPWFSIELEKGNHTVYYRISGQGESEVFRCEIKQSDGNDVLVIEDVTEPNLVDGYLAGEYISIPLLNQSPKDVKVTLELNDEYFSIDEKQIYNILTGQIFATTIKLKQMKRVEKCPHFLEFKIVSGGIQYVKVPLICIQWGYPYRFTYLEYDGTVHYASAIPPLNICPKSGCPVLLTLHGAAVNASSEAWTGAYTKQQNSWIILPTNRRKLGWDWQGPGSLNIFETLQSFSKYQPGVPKNLRDYTHIDITKLLYTGHSMGGHGCLNIATHYPDYALGIAPAAGWIKWEHYVPYEIRLSYTHMDPILKGLMQASIAEYNTDMYAENIKGIPVIVRMGQNDTVVPPWNLRRMARLFSQFESNVSAVQISEIPNEGHWWTGVVDDKIMQKFFDFAIPNTTPDYPRLPTSFEIVTLNPASSGGRGNIRILQLLVPFRRSAIHIERDDKQWRLTTQNIRRFGFENLKPDILPRAINLDGQSFSYDSFVPLIPRHFCKVGMKWQLCQDSSYLESERGIKTNGPARQIIQEKVSIVYGTKTPNMVEQYKRFAVWLANDLYLTGRNAIPVFSDDELLKNISNVPQNLILLGGPRDNLFSHKFQNQFPVIYQNGSIQIGDIIVEDSPSLGMLFLSPSIWEQKMFLVLDGSDSKGFDIASQLFPLHSGVTVPDYLIVNKEFLWKGEGGIITAGYWGNNWKHSPRSSYP